jgi:hypothetical protein
VGRSELNTVLSHLEQTLIHLARAASSPATQPVGHRLEEIEAHRRQALRRVTSGMAQRVELDGLRRGARRAAAWSLAFHGEPLAALPEECPFALPELPGDEPDAGALPARLLPPTPS